MQLLLVAQQQVPTGKAARTIGTFKGLLLGVRALMALEVFQSGKRPTTGSTDMGSGFIRFGGRDIAVCRTSRVRLSGVLLRGRGHC